MCWCCGKKKKQQTELPELLLVIPQSVTMSTEEIDRDKDLPSETVRTIHIPGSTLQPVEDSSYFKWDRFNKNVAKSIRNITQTLKTKSKMASTAQRSAKTSPSPVAKPANLRSPSVASKRHSKVSQRSSRRPPSNIKSTRSMRPSPSKNSKANTSRRSSKCAKVNSIQPAPQDILNFRATSAGSKVQPVADRQEHSAASSVGSMVESELRLSHYDGGIESSKAMHK